MNDVGKDGCIILGNCIYSLVQAARQFNKLSAFTGGNVDLCLYIKKSTKGILYVVFYVEYNLLAQNPEAIDEVVELL